MRVCPYLLSILIFCSCLADQKISQGKFFRLLKIEPTEKEALPFGGIKILRTIYRAHLEGRDRLELIDCGIGDLSLIHISEPTRPY